MLRLFFALLLMFACGLLVSHQRAAAEDKKADKKTDPKSNNKDKIIGKWELVEAPIYAVSNDGAKVLVKSETHTYMEFKDNGVVIWGLWADRPEIEAALKKRGDGLTLDLKYKLLAGNGVEFGDLPIAMQGGQYGIFGKNKGTASTKVTIDGDKMTVTNQAGKTAKLNRIKDEKKDEQDKKDK
jgi:hypothetical protein